MIRYKESELSKTIYCPYIPFIKKTTVGNESISFILNAERCANKKNEMEI